MSKFFINRPIFAWVIAIILMVAGALAIRSLPIAQYPAIAFVSADGRLSGSDLGDFIASSVQDQISRVPGVGEVQLFGAQYAMRIWLNPDQLNNYQLTPLDVSMAIQAQNAQVSA